MTLHPRREIVAAAMLGAALAACATTGPDTRGTATAHSTSTAKQEFSMSTASMTAEDIGGRVLKLIGSIHGAADLAPAHVEQVTGIKVEFNPDDRNEYGFGGKLTDVWSYNLVSLTEADGSKPSRLMFSFDDQSHANADMAPVCKIDFDGYAKALAAEGFASAPAHGEHERVLYWDFSRGDVSVHVYVQGESATASTHTCVSKLIINA